MINLKNEKQLAASIACVCSAKPCSPLSIDLWFDIKDVIVDHFFWYHILTDVRKEINEKFNPKI